MAKNKLAFVLGGGGARGALQVGALRALLEADIHPDLAVGTSIGALNAAFIGLHGFNSQALDGLVTTWRAAATADHLLLPHPGGGGPPPRREDRLRLPALRRHALHGRVPSLQELS